MTGGIGHLLSRPEGRLYPLGTLLREEVVTQWFEEDTDEAFSLGINIFGRDEFDSLDDCRQRVIVNLAFNLGPKLGQFKNTLAAFREQDYERAAQGLEGSLWYRQVGRRGKEICYAVRNGIYPFDE